MKKALKAKLSGSKNLVRRVLSQSSHVSHEPASQIQEVSMSEEAILANEIGALRDQIANLKAAINALQEETEGKEIAIAKLARDKETLNLDLLKQKKIEY
ncbi:hypothetical protein NQ314_019203 [Rhamnusium bicolor]|uniref:Uncharacterized protein n=1 Tax=Rhamnusium bicolor TaxID=1586634 RepID=A0AAV8WP10_9CUCU|nr:hypothetical protein NQ314_019203 [Rhamnusium bicolor]